MGRHTQLYKMGSGNLTQILTILYQLTHPRACLSYIPSHGTMYGIPIHFNCCILFHTTVPSSFSYCLIDRYLRVLVF